MFGWRESARIGLVGIMLLSYIFAVYSKIFVMDCVGFYPNLYGCIQ